MNSAKKLLLARIQATLDAIRVPWSLKSIQRRRSIDSKPTHDRCRDMVVALQPRCSGLAQPMLE